MDNKELYKLALLARGNLNQVSHIRDFIHDRSGNFTLPLSQRSASVAFNKLEEVERGLNNLIRVIEKQEVQ